MLSRIKIITLAAAAVGALAAAGCGTAQPAPAPVTGGGTMSGMSMPTSPSTAAAGPAVATAKISIKNFAFGPAAATVPVGTTVTWTNDDTEAHTVTMPNGPLHSPPLSPGATFSFRFTAPGAYSYLCTIHPYMRGTVVVTR